VSLILTYLVTYLTSYNFAEIIGNNIDMKKLRARVNGRRDLTANLQAAKKKKSVTFDSTSTTSAWNKSSDAPSDHAASGPTSPVIEPSMPSGGSIPSAVAASGIVSLEAAPEVINLEGSSKGGAGSLDHRAEQPRLLPTRRSSPTWPSQPAFDHGPGLTRSEIDYQTGPPQYHLSRGPIQLACKPPSKRFKLCLSL